MHARTRLGWYLLAAGLLAFAVGAPLAAAYVTKVYKTDGGDTLVVDDGGTIEFKDSGGDTVTLQGGSYGGDRTYTLPDAGGNAELLANLSKTGTKTRYGTPITIVFEPTTGETLTWTVPTGYDLLVLDAVGWKTAAAAAGGDAWDLQNNDGSAANIFDQEAIGGATLADKAMAQFDNLDDAEREVEAGDTLDLVATEDADDDGADGIIHVTGLLKTAD
ncbi:MAG: hypothetical protein R6X20_02330 [Phycisphaerae bacterium]